MNRVSSRQRLVSWDAFDAAASSDSERVSNLSDETSSTGGSSVEDNNALTQSSESLVNKRKRKNKKPIKTLQSPEWVAPHVIPAMPCEFASVSASSTSSRVSASSRSSTKKNRPKPIALLTAMLSQDAQLQVVSFLDEQDVRSLMETNHHFRHLLQNSFHVWKGLARQRWPFLSEQANWVDRLHLPQTVPALGQQAVPMNMNLLLHLAAETKASAIDESIFQPCRNSRQATLRRQQQNRETLRRSQLTTELRTVMMQDGVTTSVQFTGRIGFGDRCIRANQPLPRPHHLTNKQMRSLRKLSKKQSLWQRLLRRRDENAPQWRPFVAPFTMPDGSLSFTPRLISYFEVHIVNTKEMHKDTPQVDHPHGLQLHQVRASSSECVAVGVSLDKFHLHSRMPGWDALSYGYHGDDGGVFHNSGQMVKQYGPTFGVGDIIGCGVDYQASSLFYTINGKFLGYAFQFTEEELLMDWYPTVGVDTNSLVQCNFGTDRRFAFDLQTMIEKDRETLVQTVGPHEL